MWPAALRIGSTWRPCWRCLGVTQAKMVARWREQRDPADHICSSAYWADSQTDDDTGNPCRLSSRVLLSALRIWQVCVSVPRSVTRSLCLGGVHCVCNGYSAVVKGWLLWEFSGREESSTFELICGLGQCVNGDRWNNLICLPWEIDIKLVGEFISFYNESKYFKEFIC